MHELGKRRPLSYFQYMCQEDHPLSDIMFLKHYNTDGFVQHYLTTLTFKSFNGYLKLSDGLKESFTQTEIGWQQQQQKMSEIFFVDGRQTHGINFQENIEASPLLSYFWQDAFPFCQKISKFFLHFLNLCSVSKA